MQFLLGLVAVLATTYLYGDLSSNPAQGASTARPPPIRIDSYEKDTIGENNSPPANDFSIKLPTTPFMSEGMSSSRPTSPGSARLSSARNVSGGYFDKHVREE